MTPIAEVCAAREFTPRIQAYWVRALRAREATCVGTVKVGEGIDEGLMGEER